MNTDYNSGNYNSGRYNSGSNNSGSYNSGFYNSGRYNSGDSNSGNYNSGFHNSGNYNSGRYNSGNRNSGWFNTTEPKMRFFNKESNLTYSEFLKTKVPKINLILTRWIPGIGGYLKTFSYQEAWRNFWETCSSEVKQDIQNLPNFDPDIFEEITGIKITNNNSKKEQLLKKAEILFEEASKLMKEAQNL